MLARVGVESWIEEDRYLAMGLDTSGLGRNRDEERKKGKKLSVSTLVATDVILFWCFFPFFLVCLFY